MWDDFRLKKSRLGKLILLSKALLITALLSLIFISTIQAAPPVQGDRPPARTDEEENGGGGSGGDGNGNGNGNGNGGLSESSRCATLFGETISWGTGPVSRAVLLDGGSWEQSVVSSSEGDYNFGNLGTGVARLQIPLAPEERGQVQPLIQNAGVYLNCDYPVIANIAMFGGPRIDPPAFIEMSGPERLAPGTDIPLRITVRNDLPTGISNVIVTDLMPEGLIAQEVEAAAVPEENLMIIDAGEDGQLVVAYLDELAAGDEFNLFITVSASRNIPAGTQITNTATLFYRESAADQASLDLMIGSAGEPAPTEVPAITTPAASAPTTPTPTPEFGLVPAAASDSGPPAPLEEAEDEETDDGADFVPPGNMPSTGGEKDIVAAPAPESSRSVPVATLDDETAEAAAPAEETEEGAEFVPPATLSDTGDEEVTIPPGNLPVTGQNETLIFGKIPRMGLAPIAVLIGLGLGGLLSVYRHMYPSYRDRERD